MPFGPSRECLVFSDEPVSEGQEERKTKYSHFKKLPCCSGEITFVLLNDRVGELLTCAIDAGFLPGSYRPQAKQNGGTIRLWGS